MIEPRFPDAARSRVLLIGVGEFSSPDLPRIPAIGANLADLRQVLTNPQTGAFDPARSTVLANPVQAGEVGDALSWAATATDLLLVYYAGHGIVDERGRLFLTLPNTDLDQVRWTAISFDLLREEIASSAAAIKVLMLDCCFSGRAIEAMGDQESVVAGQLDVTGTYTLTATSANTPAHAPTGERHTAFTGTLLTALNSPEPLTLDQIYAQVDRELVARNLARPQRRVINAVGHVVLSRGRVDPTGQSDPVVLPQTPVVRFGRPITNGKLLLRTLGKYLRVLVQVILSLLLLNFTLQAMSIAAFFIYSGDLVVGMESVVMISLGMLGAGVPLALFRGRPRGLVRELLVDHTGLTAGLLSHGHVHVPWQDVAAVGVLRPGRRAFDRRLASRKVRHVLVVRLRTGTSMPAVKNVLSEHHGRLGYLGMAMLDDLNTAPEHVNDALAKFAGTRLYLHPRQFLDHDPRLRLDMI